MMTKRFFLALLSAVLLTGCGMTRQIECDTFKDNGAHVRITSANRLFYGCGLRVCEYTPKGGHPQYTLELDIQDRIIRASKGDLLTIYLTDGTTIALRNLYDAQSEVTEHVEMETNTEFHTDYVPVYDGWYDAVYTVPVTRTYRRTQPVVQRDSWIKLHYEITPRQIQQIENSEVDHIVIATDREPIEKTGRDLPEILRGLMSLFSK